MSPLAPRRPHSAAGFWMVAALLALMMVASGVLSPLFGLYQAQWGTSTFVMTAVFAVYAAGILGSLLLAGRLSDQVGRRPVLLVGLSIVAASSVLFLLADGVAWLFAARTVQGIGTGLVMSTGGAALLDLHPAGDARRAALTNAVICNGGIGLGPLLGAAMVQWLPAPLATPFIAVLVLLIAGIAGTAMLPETVIRTQRVRWRPQAPGVPAEIRAHFLLSSLGVLASWSVMGLFLALGAKLAAEVADPTDHLAGGLVIGAVGFGGMSAQLALRAMDSRRATVLGAGLVASGLIITASTLGVGGLPVLLVGSAVTGTGFGVAYMGALRSLSSIAPPEHRGQIMSAMYLVCYASMSVPALAAGLVTPALGLDGAFRLFTVAVVIVCIGVALVAARLRTDRDRAVEVAGGVRRRPRERRGEPVGHAPTTAGAASSARRRLVRQR